MVVSLFLLKIIPLSYPVPTFFITIYAQLYWIHSNPPIFSLFMRRISSSNKFPSIMPPLRNYSRYFYYSRFLNRIVTLAQNCLKSEIHKLFQVYISHWRLAVLLSIQTLSFVIQVHFLWIFLHEIKNETTPTNIGVIWPYCEQVTLPKQSLHLYITYRWIRVFKELHIREERYNKWCQFASVWNFMHIDLIF